MIRWFSKRGHELVSARCLDWNPRLGVRVLDCRECSVLSCRDCYVDAERLCPKRVKRESDRLGLCVMDFDCVGVGRGLACCETSG